MKNNKNKERIQKAVLNYSEKQLSLSLVEAEKKPKQTKIHFKSTKKPDERQMVFGFYGETLQKKSS